MQIVRFSEEGKGTDGGERIIKPTTDKTLSELKKHLDHRLENICHIPDTTNDKQKLTLVLYVF